MNDELMTKQATYDVAFSEMVDTSIYARVQLMGFNSELVKSGKFPGGHFALVINKDAQDIGESFEALPLAWRPKAMSVANNEIKIFYDHTIQDFKDIVEQAEEPNSGCMYGPEFLLYLPEKDIVATYFLSNKSARYIAEVLRGYLKKSQPVTFSVHFVKGKKFSWHAPKVNECSAAIVIAAGIESVQKDIEKFLNPDEHEELIAESVNTTERAR